MKWGNKKKLQINSQLAGTPMCISLGASVGSEKSRLGLDVSNSILCSSLLISAIKLAFLISEKTGQKKKDIDQDYYFC